ncbi:dicarboxylate/amino acid:cation symporter [Anaerorhabdus sp.]|uniref:dicarboxylate/amino acid:cation symporter n=1 Tax=Anaerorhabdus sp. TaxID=1872524 RepID=UPI002FC6F8E3
MKKISLSKKMIIASICGLAFGIIFSDFSKDIKFIGDIFLRLMQMSVVFLVMGAMIESVGSIAPKDLGKLGIKAILLFLVTTLLSATIGILVVNIIKPGIGINIQNTLEFTKPVIDNNIIDMIINFVPINIFKSMSEGNMIQVIIFSIFFGLAISTSVHFDEAQHVLSFIKSVNAVIMRIIELVMVFAPIGIFALIASMTGNYGITILIPLGKYLIAMIIGAISVFGIGLIVVGLYAKVAPHKILLKLKDTIVVSMTTTSSAVSLPMQMHDCENKLGISKRVSRLVNPLAMSLNSDGLALSISIACIMIAQFFGIELTLYQQIIIVLISTFTTMGNLLVPGGALVAFSVAFTMVGLPIEGIALLAGVEWFAGIPRTLLNVIDDVLITMFIAVNEKEFDREKFNESK